MNTKLYSVLFGLALLAGVRATLAQNPILTWFSQNGVLVCSKLHPSSVASVQWASLLAGPWNGDWTSLGNVPVGTNQTLEVRVPMFYRVLGISGTNSTADGMVFIPAGSFTIGDTTDGDLARYDAAPTNVYVSAFYMDANLVSYSQWSPVVAYGTSHG